MKWLILVSTLAISLVAYGCSDSESCASDADCFAGETCDEGTCAPVGGNNVTTANNASTSNATTNGNAGANMTTGQNNSSTNNSTTSSNNSTNNLNPNNGGASCEVDPFTATCEDDEWEENDQIDRTEALPIDSQSWCNDGALSPNKRFSGTFCAGDELDLYRFLIDNRTPDVCLDGPFTLRIEVTIEQTCNPQRIQVEPYTFFDDPRTNDLCADDENVRCTSANGGQTRIIEWLREADQLNDFYLLIGNDENNVQFDYEVSLTVTP